MKKSLIKFVVAVALGILVGQFAGTKVIDKEVGTATSYRPHGVKIEKHFNKRIALIAGSITTAVALVIFLIPNIRLKRKHTSRKPKVVHT